MAVGQALHVCLYHHSKTFTFTPACFPWHARQQTVARILPKLAQWTCDARSFRIPRKWFGVQGTTETRRLHRAAGCSVVDVCGVRFAVAELAFRGCSQPAVNVLLAGTAGWVWFAVNLLVPIHVLVSPSATRCTVQIGSVCTSTANKLPHVARGIVDAKRVSIAGVLLVLGLAAD